jgi:hypothetical protein
MDVAKVDQDVSYVAVVVHVCYKRMFLMFHLCFQTYIISVYMDVHMFSDICCKCFIWMLHMFVMVIKYFLDVFLQVFQKHVSSVSSIFRRERIKMPKRGVNWAFLKINCKN